MGLDATVYCNCFETGRLKEQFSFSELIYVADDGTLGCRSEKLETLLEFDQWLLQRACEHEKGVLLHHRIGNIALVSLLHSELSSQAGQFPVILEKILYSGSHTGDYLSLDMVEKLKTELDYLGKFVSTDLRNQGLIDYFRQQLFELVKAASKVRKPISF